MLVCSLGEGDWEMLDYYRLRGFSAFHYYYYYQDFPRNYNLLLGNESLDDCGVGEIGLGEDY